MNKQKMPLREIEEFYRVLKTNPQANIKNLIHNIKLMDIGKVSFTTDDSNYLDLYCGYEYMINQDNFPEDKRQDCSICLSLLERGEQVICHPGCKHEFHQVCLLYWLLNCSKVGRCPNCKNNTRTELFTYILNSRITDVIEKPVQKTE